MKGFDSAYGFGPDVAATYDVDGFRGDESVAVAFLARKAGSGQALELAIGTGRIAVPLAQQGIRVDGMDLSPDMVEQLRRKAGGERLEVIVGDMATESAPGSNYTLVYLVYNTIFNILTQDGQVRCFENAARHLAPNGVFVVEAAVPSAWVRRDQFVNVESLDATRVVLDVNRYDAATQVLDENHVSLTEHGVRMGPISCRLIWPSEMDLMARIVGLELVERWADWNCRPYDAASTRHVSVYARTSA